MVRRLFIRRTCSVLALVLVATGSFGVSPAASAKQDPASAARHESPQAAGDLDPTFGNAGIKITDFFGNYDTATGLALQADGKIVAAGLALHGSALSSGDFALARYNPDGSLDPGFGAAGKLTSDFFGNLDQADGVAIESGGKIVVVGVAKHSDSSSTGDFALARYNPDGSLDPGFGAAGKHFDQANGVVIQPDGKIVAAGYAQHGDDNPTADFALARYKLDGNLDKSFGSGGKVTTDFGGEDVAYAIAIQSDSKLVVAGLAFNGGTGSTEFALARYNPDGSLDQAFGAGGKQTTDFFGKACSAFSVALQPDGKIVAAGYATLGNSVSTFDFALARYNPDGSLDQTFGAGGKQTTDFFGDADDAGSVAIQADGKIVVAGAASHGSSTGDLALARYNPDGTLDQTFGPSGLRTTNLQGHSDDNDRARAVAIQPDGNIVVAGETARPVTATVNVDFAIARYSASTGASDFTISFNPSSVSGQSGSKVSLTVLINRNGGFGGNVTVTPPAASMGIKPKPPDPIMTSSSSAVFKMKIGGGVSPGSYDRTFTAADDSGKTRTATVTIVVQ
jgi:uncharacterized delta-60 repeat protein